MIRLAAVSPLGAAVATASQPHHTSQPLSFDVAVIGGSTTGVFAAAKAVKSGLPAVKAYAGMPDA